MIYIIHCLRIEFGKDKSVFLFGRSFAKALALAANAAWKLENSRTVLKHEKNKGFLTLVGKE